MQFLFQPSIGRPKIAIQANLSRALVLPSHCLRLLKSDCNKDPSFACSCCALNRSTKVMIVS
jgi:hypothetical protein